MYLKDGFDMGPGFWIASGHGWAIPGTLFSKYQDLFFQTEQTVNRKKSGFRAAQKIPKLALVP